MIFRLSCASPSSMPVTSLPAAIKLLPPRLNSEMSLLEALKERKSIREFDTSELTDQEISNLLWAANGINRSETNGRTAPSAYGVQDVSLYVVLKRGAFYYNAKDNRLEPAVSGDLTKDTGGQEFVAQASLNLVYVADLSKHLYDAKKDGLMFSAAATGCIVQNVYLYCASRGLGTVVRGSIDRVQIARQLGLRSNERVILAQTVGIPKTK